MVFEAERLLRRGLARTYRSQSSRLVRLSGRVDPLDFATANLTGRSRVQCSFSQYTTSNAYNQLVALGLIAASRISSDRATRSRARRATQQFDIEPPRYVKRPKFYGGQYAEYAGAHQLATLLLDGLGVGDRRVDTATIAPFSVATNLLFESFLLSAVRHALGRMYQVRRERLRVFDRGAESQRTLRPDIVVREVATQRLVLIIDAKYEASFPQLPASDHYQAYVYGDIFGRAFAERPLPVVLAAPYTETVSVEYQRVSSRLDARPHRPITWLLGIGIRELVDAIRRRGPRHEPKLAEQLMLIVASTGEPRVPR